MEEIMEQVGPGLLHILTASSLIVLVFSLLSEGGVLYEMAESFMTSLCG